MTLTRMKGRVGALENVAAAQHHGPAILMQKGQSEETALAHWEARYGKRKGEPLFIHLVGVTPEPTCAEQ